MANLTTSTILVKLNISQWKARKLDKKVTEEVAQQHKAAPDVGSYRKSLLAHQDLESITKIVSRARDYNYKNTLPWSDWGERILPIGMYEEYTAKMREFRQEFEARVAEFVTLYPALVQDARNRLNGLYREDDYPDPGTVGNKFRFDFHFSPIPEETTDVRVALSAEDVARIQRDVAAQKDEAVKIALRDLWGRLAEVVADFKGKVENKDSIFRDSKITNLLEVCAVVGKLNFMNDPGLNDIRARVERDLASYHPDTLRTNDAARAEAAKSAADILSKMSGFMGTN